jgi:hypothetical protein
VYDLCDVCGDRVVRDFYRAPSGDVVAGEWLGICSCPTRKWRWVSPTGDTPWRLVGYDNPRQPN